MHSSWTSLSSKILLGALPCKPVLTVASLCIKEMSPAAAATSLCFKLKGNFVLLTQTTAYVQCIASFLKNIKGKNWPARGVTFHVQNDFHK